MLSKGIVMSNPTPYWKNNNTLYFPAGTYTKEQVQAAMSKKSYDPKYQPNQQPPFPKTEVALVCAVICSYFTQVCQYHGINPRSFSSSDTTL